MSRAHLHGSEDPDPVPQKLRAPLPLPQTPRESQDVAVGAGLGVPLRSHRRLQEEQRQNNARVALLREPVTAGTNPRHVLDTGFVLPLCVPAEEPGGGLAPGVPIVSHLSYRREEKLFQT